MADKKFFDLLQVYRGIAALLVVIHHTYTSFSYFKGLNFPPLEFIASIGKYGVDFFFVLSGFIIAFTTFRFRDNPNFLKKYTFNRIIRIYIPYLPISIGMLILYAIIPGFSDSNRSISLLTSLTLIPNGNPALSVAWTLVFEMFFYLVYGLNFFSKKLWYGFLTLWICSIIGVNIFDVDAKGAFANLVFNMYNLEFIFGVFVAYVVKSQIIVKRNYSLLFACLSFLVFLMIKILELKTFRFSTNLLFAFSMGWFVYLAVKYWNVKMGNRSIAMLIGNSSYSLYLLHNPIQSFMVKLLPDLKQQYLILLEFTLVVIVCCIVSYLYYLVFEKKVLNKIKLKFEPVFIEK
ncbi:acyltransferase family protein [Moheibacter lacus]|uniref:Acyltransferase n=1 Tax=Moheibacter lacus TaxID=2745851 RepID=A0A838ZI45_9FLAO|nr:acyltransferase [Moheibacter lacus]MBA5628918.1 acyltransferase [Moheibacter lacus]